MIGALLILLLLTALLWAALQIAVCYGWMSVVRGPIPRPLFPDDLSVSVVIAARNEEANIARCVESVLRNDYPAARFEVIVVDDYSSDDTSAEAQSCARPAFASGAMDDDAVESLRVLQATHGHESGSKPLALQQGIDAAQGEIILTTDADCRVGREWIRNIVAHFQEDTALVAGPVYFSPTPTLFEKLQAVEFMGLIAFGAGTIGLGSATICNSANLAYRREAYEDFQANASYPAADELLLQELEYNSNHNVHFCASPEAAVETEPTPSLSAFWHQRSRWASMGTRYPQPRIVAVAGLTWLFHTLLLIATVLSAFLPAIAPAVLLAWLLKLIPDASVTIPALYHFGQHRLIPYVPLAQLLHPLYVFAVGVAGTFGTVRWKS